MSPSARSACQKSVELVIEGTASTGEWQPVSPTSERQASANSLGIISSASGHDPNPLCSNIGWLG